MVTDAKQFNIRFNSLNAPMYAELDKIQRLISNQYNALNSDPSHPIITVSRATPVKGENAANIVVTYEKQMEEVVRAQTKLIKELVKNMIPETGAGVIAYSGHRGVKMLSHTVDAENGDLARILKANAELNGMPAPVRVPNAQSRHMYRVQVPVDAVKFNKAKTANTPEYLDKAFAASYTNFVTAKSDYDASKPLADEGSSDIDPSASLKEGAKSGVIKQLLNRFIGVAAVLRLIHSVVDSFKKAFEAYAENALGNLKSLRSSVAYGASPKELESLRWFEKRLGLDENQFDTIFATVRNKFNNATSLNDAGIEKMALYTGSDVARLIGTGEYTPAEQTRLIWDAFVKALNDKNHPIWKKGRSSTQQILQDMEDILGNEATSILEAGRTRMGRWLYYDDMLAYGSAYTTLSNPYGRNGNTANADMDAERKASRDMLASGIGSAIQPIVDVLNKIFTFLMIHAPSNGEKAGQLYAVKAPMIANAVGKAGAMASRIYSMQSSTFFSPEELEYIDENKLSSIMKGDNNAIRSLMTTMDSNAVPIPISEKAYNQFNALKSNPALVERLYSNIMFDLYRKHFAEFATKKFSNDDIAKFTSLEDWMAKAVAEDPTMKYLVTLLKRLGFTKYATYDFYSGGMNDELGRYITLKSMTDKTTLAAIRGDAAIALRNQYSEKQALAIANAMYRADSFDTKPQTNGKFTVTFKEGTKTVATVPNVDITNLFDYGGVAVNANTTIPNSNKAMGE